ncbi:MAG: PilZ domain-containing protein, partial [Nitrospirota bacterium]
MLEDKKRRQFRRYKHRSEFQLSIGRNSFKAITIDYSLGGLGFSVESTPSITLGSIIDVNIKDINLNIKGKVVWTQNIERNLRVGIKGVSVSGLLKYYPLSDIFLDLQKSEKTGILEIRDGLIYKKAYIKNGDIVFARSNLKEDRFGEFLLRSCRITPDQHYRTVALMKKTRKRYGAILIELGYLRAEDLICTVKHQV